MSARLPLRRGDAVVVLHDFGLETGEILSVLPEVVKGEGTRYIVGFPDQTSSSWHEDDLRPAIPEYTTPAPEKPKKNRLGSWEYKGIVIGKKYQGRFGSVWACRSPRFGMQTLLGGEQRPRVLTAPTIAALVVRIDEALETEARS